METDGPDEQQLSLPFGFLRIAAVCTESWLEDDYPQFFLSWCLPSSKQLHREVFFMSGDHDVEEDGPAVGGNNHALGSCQWPGGSGVPDDEPCWRLNAGAICHALSGRWVNESPQCHPVLRGSRDGQDPRVS